MTEKRIPSHDQLEFIIKVAGKEFRSVPFDHIKQMQNSLESVLLLWDTASFRVSSDGTFLINGGRYIRFDHLGPCVIECRRRVRRTLGRDGNVSDEVTWVLGLVSTSMDTRAYLLINENGTDWSWSDRL